MSEDFNRDYQEHILARMLKDKEFLKGVSMFMAADVFDEDLAPAVDFVLKQFHKSGKIPAPAQIRQYVPNTRLPTPGKSPIELDRDALLQFTRTRRVRKTMLEASQQLQAGDIEEAISTLAKSGRGFSDDENAGFSFFGNNNIQASRGVGLPTGQRSLDKAMQGVCPGEMALVMAPSNGGKSAWLIHVAALAIQKGMNVFFASLEMTATSMKMRFEEKFDTMKLPKRKRGNLWISCSTPDVITPAKLNSLLDKTDYPAHVICIDSGDLMAPPRKFGSQWEEETGLIREVKGIALDRSAIMWVAYQANRTGYGTELIDLKNIKGAIAKVQTADQVISLNQDEAEAMVDPETGECLVRAYLPKNRFGPKGAIANMTVRFASCTFEEIKDYDI